MTTLILPSARIPDPKETLNVGDRVRLNDRGRQRFKEGIDRRGVVVSVSSTKSAYRVRWDNLAAADYLHWSYLVRDSGK